MATIYVRSTDGNNGDSGATWALAKATLAGAAAIDAAGDTIYVSQNHAESTASLVSLSWAGTIASPTTIICANDGAEPPTAVATSATVTTTSNSPLELSTVAGVSAVYYYGFTFACGTGTSAANLNIGTSSSSHSIRFENCSFQLNTTTPATSYIVCGSSGANDITFNNCTFKFADAASSIRGFGPNKVRIGGGSLLSGGTSPTALFVVITNTKVLVEGFDLSNANAAINLCGSTGSGGTLVQFRNVKLPASWSGSLNSSVPSVGARFELTNTDSTNTNYRLWIKDAYGDITHETTLIKTGGANNGTIGISWKYVTTADAKFQNPLASGEITEWNAVTGSSMTATIDILHDSATNLKDDEIWLEVQYLSSSGTPLGAFVSDAKANILATGADQTTSSATWTTTGMSNPNKQKLSVTFTPQMAGVVHVVVKVAKASYTLYVDPKLTIE